MYTASRGTNTFDKGHQVPTDLSPQCINKASIRANPLKHYAVINSDSSTGTPRHVAPCLQTRGSAFIPVRGVCLYTMTVRGTASSKLSRYSPN